MTNKEILQMLLKMGDSLHDKLNHLTDRVSGMEARQGLIVKVFLTAIGAVVTTLLGFAIWIVQRNHAP